MAEGEVIYTRLLLSACFLTLIGCELFSMNYLKSMIPHARTANITIEKKPASTVTECNLECLAKQNCKSSIYAGSSRTCVLLRSIPENVYSFNLTNEIGRISSNVVLSRLVNNSATKQLPPAVTCYNCNCNKRYNAEENLCETSVQGFSCLDIKSNACSGSCLSGYYNIRLNSSKIDTIRVYCDMETDKGGWTKVLNLISNTSAMAEFKQVSFKTWHNLTNFNANGSFYMHASALKELQVSTNFTQIRFMCNLTKENKYVHLATKKNAAGKAALDWLIGESTGNVGPSSCGSFEPFPDDNSQLGKNCSDWKDGTWGNPAFSHEYRMLDHPMFIAEIAHWNILGFFTAFNRFECDNLRGATRNIDIGDTWQIFVR